MDIFHGIMGESTQSWTIDLMRWLTFLLKLSRPIYILGSILLYSLGVGIAKYIGVTIHWNIFFLGLAWILLLQIGSFALYNYFNLHISTKNNDSSNPNSVAQRERENRLESLAQLVVFFCCLAIAGSITVLIMQANRLLAFSIILMATVLIGGILYSLPPVRLSNSGYGELLLAILFANVIPAFAYNLQAGDIHRLIAMTTFPLTPLFLAMIIAHQFPTYSHDVQYGIRTIMIRMGWQNALNLHNILIVCAYLLLAIALFFQLPIFIGAPVFLTIPLGIFQMWQMKRINDGAKPNWKVLNTSWIFLCFSVVYLLVYSFWIR